MFMGEAWFLDTCHMPPLTTQFRIHLPSLAGNLMRTGPCSLSLCPRNSEGMEIKNHNPEILSFTFLKIKGKIRGSKHVRLETQRDGETLGCGHEALGTSAHTETWASQPPSETSSREAGAKVIHVKFQPFCILPKTTEVPSRFYSPHTIKCSRTSPWSHSACLCVARTST